MATYPSKPSSAPAIPFNSVGRSKNLNDIFSAIAIEKLLALKTDGTYADNFSIGDNALNSLVNEINIRQGSTIKEYDSTGANLLRTLTLGSATNLVQGFRYLDEPIKISNNATNPTSQIDVSAGIMTFDDGTGQVRLSASLTKSTANDFANGGLLPNGTVLQTNTTYYVFAIYSSASNLVSFYADTNKTSPTLPTSPNTYDKKEYRGAFYVDGSGNIATGSYIYSKNDYEFWFKDKTTVDYTRNNPGTNRVFVPLLVPNGDVKAYFSFSYEHFGSTGNDYGIIRPETDNDSIVGASNYDFRKNADTDNFDSPTEFLPCVNSQITYKLSFSNTNVSVLIKTRGWQENL